MSQINDTAPVDQPDGKSFWRSLGQLKKEKSFLSFLHREFQEDASVLEDPVSRRTFLKLMGASAALMGATGCVTSIRRPKQIIRPYVRRPENHIPGKPTYYATAMAVGSSVAGLLVETHDGRPTKIEGNPAHSMSLGSASAIHQASVLELYDPDRLQSVYHAGEPTDLNRFQEWVSENSVVWRKTGGAGVGILVDTQMSPTVHRLLEMLQKQYPRLAFYYYDALNQDAILAGSVAATGQRLVPDYDFSVADVVVSLDADFLGSADALKYSKAFSARRDPDGDMNRLYAFDPQFSVTSGKADHRYAVKASEIVGVAFLLAEAVIRKAGAAAIPATLRSVVEQGARDYAELIPENVIDAIADDLIQHRSRSLIVVGPRQDAAVHGLVYALNLALGNVGRSVVYRQQSFLTSPVVGDSAIDSLSKLVQSAAKGALNTLFVLGGNPVYAAPADVALTDVFKSIDTVVHLSFSENETSRASKWVVPRSHYLESWGDLRAIDGSISVVQPVIRPMVEGYSDIAFLMVLLSQRPDDYSAVRSTLSAYSGVWRSWLHNGVVSGPMAGLPALPVIDRGVSRGLRSIAKREDAHAVEVALYGDFKLYDGRFANNGWLQELPDPITKLTWDNTACISPKMADSLKVKTGDMLRLKMGDTVLDIAALIMPGHAQNSVSVALGYGREIVGRVGEKSGFNAYTLFNGGRFIQTDSVEVSKLRKTYPLSVTQDHGSMEGRPLVRETHLEDYREHPDFAKKRGEPHPPLNSLWEERKYDTGYQWGMAIDLAKCTGCNACVTACQSENNIPIVGKDQVSRGREMHWIRIDRYYEGDPDDPTLVHQPVTCLQCENAPCEQVCPVAATTHSEDGLNDMAYNRCIGTRYCSNNCPVKVRRFNFYDFHQRNPQAVAKNRQHLFDYMKTPAESVQMQFNPDVTVRMRGVMEKCTYCVQRINAGKIDAKNKGRSLKDGEVVTACQQTCPSDAIVFGDINDPNSRVTRLKEKRRDYHILEQLHLKARTSYLASVLNPNPRLFTKERVLHAQHS